MPTLSEDNPFRASVLPETQVLLAGQDLLTGLSSRAGLDAHYRLAVARARRSGARFAVGLAVIDVDAAAPADEVFGHDLLMMEAARRLRASLRETDVIARVGETRFAFLAEEVTAAGVGGIVGRVVHALVPDTDRPSAGRARVGIAFSRDAQESLPALLRSAEEALGTAAPAMLAPDAANAESFGAPSAPDDRGPLRSPARSAVRRTLGWVSLGALIALGVAAAPPEWRNRWFPLDSTVQYGWDTLRERWPALPPTPAALRR